MTEQKTATPEPAVAPAPKEPTPLDPPVVYFNVKWRTPPLVVDTQEQADALDPTEWTTNPPPPSAKWQDIYPKLYGNVNLEPKIVNDAAEEKALSSDWRNFTLPADLIKAAQATATAKQVAQHAPAKK